MKDDFVENFTKANPFGFPSGLIIILILSMLPHGSNNSLISPSKALKDSPWTATSNYPCSYSTTGCFAAGFLTTSAEPFLFGAGFYSYSDSYYFSIFLTGAFFFGCGFYYSESSSLSWTFLTGFLVASTLIASFDPFLGFGFYSDSYSDSYFWTALTGFFATTYFDPFLGFGFSSSSDYYDEVYFLATFFTGWALTGFFGAYSYD